MGEIILLSPEEKEIIEYLSGGKKRYYTIGKLSEKYNCSAEEAVKMIDRIARKGYSNLRHDRVVGKVWLDVSRPSLSEFQPTEVEIYKKTMAIGLIAETRIGCVTAQTSILYKAYDIFDDEKVSFVLHAGNTFVGLLGAKRKDEVMADLMDPIDQTAYAVEYYPQNKSGYKTYFIDGRRDISSYQKDGYNAVKQLCEERKELIYRGANSHTFFIRGKKCMIHVVNPFDDNIPYAATYKPQSIAYHLVGEDMENIKNTQGGTITVLGGLHIPAYFPDEGMRVVMLPSLHAQTKYQKGKGISPRLGFAILYITFDDNDDVLENSIRVKFFGGNCIKDDLLESSISSDELGNGLLKLLEQQDCSLGELSRSLNQSRKQITQVLTSLTSKGYDIELLPATKQYTWHRQLKKNFHPHHSKTAVVVKMAFVSDMHLGSNDQLLSLLRKIYEEYLPQEKPDLIINAGNMVDGPGSVGPPGRRHEIFLSGIDEQVEYARLVYPHSAIPTYVIAGACHEGWVWNSHHHDMVKHICEKRPDLRYLGRVAGTLNQSGLNIKIVHPSGGLSYARSYKMQKYIEDMVSEFMSSADKYAERINLLIIGHYHKALFIGSYGGVDGFLAAGLKAKDEYLEKLGKSPDIGFWFADYELDELGNIIARTVRYINLAKYQIAHDYSADDIKKVLEAIG